MKINTIWINNEKKIDQTLINICADLNTKQYKYCATENTFEPTTLINGTKYYLNQYVSFSANYTSAKILLN